MSAVVLPNAVPGKVSVRSGSGVGRHKLFCGHLTVVGAAGDVARLNANDYANSGGSDIVIQASGGTVQVFGTLADPDLAVNPSHDSGDHWVLMGTAAPGAFLALPHFVTALRLNFQTAAIAYVVTT